MPGSEAVERIDRRERRRAGRRRAILDAALGVVEALGIDAFSMSAVAEAADVSKPALFYYFESKAALLGALVGHVLEQESEVLLRAVEGAPDDVAALEALTRAHFEFHFDNLRRYRLFLQWAQHAGEQHEMLQTQVYPAVGHLNDVLEARLQAARARGELHPDVHPRRIGNVAWFTAEGLLTLACTFEPLGGETRFAFDELLDEACANLRRGVSPEARSA